MAGAPSQLDLFDYKPKLQEFDGQPVPEDLIKGERFAFIRGTPKLLGSPQTFAARSVRRADFGTAAAPGARGGRPSHREIGSHDAVQPCAGADLHEYGPPDHRPAEHGRVADLWPGERERQPAGFRRAALRREPARRRQVLLGQWIPPHVYQGVEFRSMGTRCCSFPTRMA